MTRTIFEERTLQYHIVEDEETGQYFVGPILPPGRRVIPREPEPVRHPPARIREGLLVAAVWCAAWWAFWWFVIRYGWTR